MRVYVKEDALMTFKTKIEESDILATRCSVVGEDGGNVGYNSFLDDSMWRCDSTSLYWLSGDLYNGYFDYSDEDPTGHLVGQMYVIATAG